MFRRGVSFTSSTTGARYDLSASQAARRKAHDEDAYFDEPEESEAAAPAAADDDDPLDAYMRELEGVPPPKKAKVASVGKAVADRTAQAEAQQGAAQQGAAQQGAAQQTQQSQREVEEEADPLDAFMAGLAAEQSKEATSKPAPKPAAQCDEEEDHVASFVKARAEKSAEKSWEKKPAQREGSSDEGGEEDAGSDSEDGAEGADDGARGARRQLKDQKGKMDLLPPLNHESISYAEFNKCFYTAHRAIAALSEAEVADRRRALDVSCTGFDLPRPLSKWEEAGKSHTSLSHRRLSPSVTPRVFPPRYQRSLSGKQASMARCSTCCGSTATSRRRPYSARRSLWCFLGAT